MAEAERGDAGVVHAGPIDAGLLDERPQRVPVSAVLGQRDERGRLEPGVDLVQRRCNGRRRAEDAGVGRNR